MNPHPKTIEDTSSVKGERAWGLSRSQGSMFFLEVGKPLPRDVQKTHGEWHFLFEMCHWRLEKADSIVIGSEDEQGLIDNVFSMLELGSISSAGVTAPSNDLTIEFDVGLKLKTFTLSSGAKADWTQWYLFTPDNNAWTSDAKGDLLYSRIYV